MFEFTLFRIPIRVEPLHWLILFLLGGGMGLDGRESLIAILLFMLAGFFSILVHELGHALTGRKFGARDVNVVLHGMGGVAIFPQARFSRKESFLVTAAGPGIQLVLGGLALLILREVSANPGTSRFFYYLYMVSIFWAVLNCIPVYPLDGGQMLSAILGPSRQVLVLQISIATAIIVGAGLLIFTRRPLFAIFLGFMAYQNYQMLQEHKNRWR